MANRIKAIETTIRTAQDIKINELENLTNPMLLCAIIAEKVVGEMYARYLKGMGMYVMG